MKHIPLFLLMMTIMITGCKQTGTEGASTAAGTEGTDTSKTAEAPVMDSAAMMQAWQDFMTPGDRHAWMAKSAGTWEMDIKSWMDPAAPPAESKATSIIAMELNGLYQTTHLTGTMMGAPFEGRGIMGFDNAKKMFVSSWVDNLGSGIMQMSGTWDEAGKTLNLKGTQTDPVTGKDSDVRQEWKILDDNNHMLTMYGVFTDGKEMKFMEAMAKRKT